MGCLEGTPGGAKLTNSQFAPKILNRVFKPANRREYMRTIGVTKLRDWDFTRREGGIDDAAVWADDVWEHVTVPHDWAIHGEFRRENDLEVTRASPFACRPWS